MTTAPALRYQLPKKSIKGDCPQCGPTHRRTLSRYTDTRTGELLPDAYGRCDRESNCGYSLSPYHKGPSGISYADEVNGTSNIPPHWFKLAGKWKRQQMKRENIAATLVKMEGATMEQADLVTAYLFDRQPNKGPIPPAPIYSIPDEVFRQSIGHYDRNQFARLLDQQFGPAVASDLLQRFQIGTSVRWPGACVFWSVDEQGRARAGQVIGFNNDWHKAWYVGHKGEIQPCISFVNSCLLSRYRRTQQPAPDWLTDYERNAPRWPILFGLHQLSDAPADTPVAIVEAPKTAVICSHYLPGFIWLATGTKSNLTLNTTDGPGRVRALRGRRVVLYPDLNAYHDTTNAQGSRNRGWKSTADQLQAEGFAVEVSDYLEQHATDEQKRDGLDLADFLLQQPPTISTLAEQLARPGTLLRPNPADMVPLPALPPADQSGRPGTVAATTDDQPPPVLTTSTNRPLLEALARCLNLPADAVPLYQLTRP